MAAENLPTASEYIVHHLTNWTAHSPKGIIDFSIFNIDSLFWSSLLGAVVCFFLWRAAKRMTSGVPGRFQAAVEILVEWVDNEAKGVIHNAESRKLASPLALVLFLWILLMNGMDLLPVDLLPQVWAHIVGAAGGDPHHAYMRVVPTADLPGMFALSISVLLLCFFYSIKIKGLGGWAHELVTKPFGTSRNPVLALVMGVINFVMQLIEFAAKTVSHAMRLFGNMYAGELVFALIALMGGAMGASLGGVLLPIGQILAGTAWAIFHLLIITIQAFIFMILALVYIGQAHDAH